jgi:cellulose synthase/poly-beta-1,6-N-acetylglucosamine synthase-like glycosyltransferase
MTGIAATFWVSLLAIVYAYAGYPALLWLVSRLKRRAPQTATGEGAPLPPVTMIVSAYNEEAVIRDKIENALSLDYPRALLQIIVVSDGSTDRTCAIVSEYAARGVALLHYEGRIGKTACLNRALPAATGEIVVFSDANSAYGRGALRALTRPFQDRTVGFVTGWTRYSPGEAGAEADSLGIYSALELVTKELESRLGSCIGADGAIFAIRKALYVPLKSYDINDFVLPLAINQQGYRGVLEREAICYEKGAGSAKGEFQRQVRITNRTIRAIFNHRGLLNPLRFGFLSFELASHKLCRFLVPLFMVALLAASWPLAAHAGFYALALAAQVVFYGAVAAAAFVPAGGVAGRIVEAARTFFVVNAAIALAWLKYLQGETYTTWSPTKR